MICWGHVRIFLSPFLLSLLFFPTTGSPDSFTWVGNTNNSMNTAANWDPASVPTSAVTTALIFPDGPFNVSPSQDIAVTFILKDLTFSGATIYDLSGSELQFGDALTAGTISVTGDAPITVANRLHVPSQLTVTISDLSGQLELNGIIDSVGALQKTGPGLLILTRANTYSGGTTVTEGTLQGTTTSLQGAIVNNGVVVFDQTVTDPYTGNMSGSGSLQKKNTGTLTLSGNNSYSGGTLLSEGSIQVSSNTALGTGDITVTSGTNFAINGSVILPATNSFFSDNCTLGMGNASEISGSVDLSGTVAVDVSTANTATISGTLKGSGGLKKTNAGTLIVTGENSYSGGTIISAGTLKGNTSSLQGTFDNSESIVFNQITDGIFSGSISGIGGVQKEGPGTLTFLTPNTYTSQTALNEGTLVLGVDGAIGTTDLIISSTSTLRLSPNTSFSNSISIATTANLEVLSGTAALTGPITGADGVKTGAGTLILSGANTYSSSFTTNAGTTAINNNFSAPILTNNGILQGTGIITAPLTNNGTLSPGMSIGTLTIIGDYFENGTYFAEIDTSGNSDLIDVMMGNIIINPGSTLIIAPAAGRYTLGTSWTLLQTDGTVSGEYTTVQSPLPLLHFSPIYNMQNVQIVFDGFNPFQTIAMPRNPQAVGSYLDTLAPDATGDLALIINQLRFETTGLIDALNQLHPAPFKVLPLTAQNNLSNIRRAIGTRTLQFYETPCNRARPETCARASHPQQRDDWDLRRFFGHRKLDPKQNRPRKETCTRPHWSLWGDAVGDFSWQSGNPKQLLNGYKSSTGGSLIGSDYTNWENIYLGAAAGYSYTDLRWDETKDKGSLNSGYIALYTTWAPDFLALNGAIVGSFTRYSANRTISFGTIDRKAKHHNYGGGLDVHFDGAYLYHHPQNLDIAPFASFDYQFLHDGGFTESGAESLDLVVASQNYNLFRSELGLRLSRCFPVSFGKWIPDAEVSWVRELRVGSREYQSHFKNQPGSFQVIGIYPNRTLVAPGAGLTGLFLKDSLSFTLRYDGEIGANFSNHTGTLQGIWLF